MKKISKGAAAAILAAGLLLALGLITVAAPTAGKARIKTEFRTSLSAANWTAPSVYAGGWQAEEILRNGESVGASFVFGAGDTLTIALPDGDGSDCRIGVLYHTENEKPSDTLFHIRFEEQEYTAFLPLPWQDEVGEARYRTDRYGNEIANRQFASSDTIFSPFFSQTDVNAAAVTIALDGGELWIENQGQEIIVEEIWLYSEKEAPSYEDYRLRWSRTAASEHEEAVTAAPETVVIQGEDFSIKSDAGIRSANVNNLALSPYDTYHRLINTLDGSSFSEAGQKVMWEFEVAEDGWYELGFRMTQNSAVGKTVYRQIEIDGILPFAELSQAAFAQTGNLSYETMFLLDEQGNPYQIYLTKGRHTLALTADFGPTEEVYEQLRALIGEMNELGMALTMLTAGVTDQNRTWDMDSYLPNAVPDIQSYAERAEDCYDRLYELEGGKPTYADSLLYASQVLNQLLEKPRLIPNRMNLFHTGDNSAVKHITTVINKMTDLSLGIDEIYIKSAEASFVQDKPSFFLQTANAVRRFLYSLNPEAVKGTGGSTGDEEALQVWVSRSSVYVQVLQNMADSAEELAGIPIDISIMPSQEKLTLSAAAGTNPDVALGVAMSVPYKFALRGAAKDLTEYEDFLPFYDSQYNLEGLVPCAYDGGVYGAVETQDYNVLFYRTDILEALQIEVPDTWEDVKAIMPTLLRYNKNINLPVANTVGFKGFGLITPYLYQNEGQLYAADGGSVAFTQRNTLDGMKELTNLIKIYAVDDYIASFYNSFRSGDTPMGIGGVSMYVQLSEAAPELAGLWDIALVPGTVTEDGRVVRDMCASTTAGMIFENTEHSEEAWAFLKWWLSAETQAEFADTLELAYGPEYRWNTANLVAFEESSYPEKHKEIIRQAWESQKETIPHPASYIVERELSNAYINVTVNTDTVVEAMEQSSHSADREILRKLKEFGFCDEEGNLLRDYPIEALESIREKLGEQKEQQKKEESQ